MAIKQLAYEMLQKFLTSNIKKYKETLVLCILYLIRFLYGKVPNHSLPLGSRHVTFRIL